MPATDSTAHLLRFGIFELDLRNNELRRNGVRLKLTPQQFQLLRQLADSGGRLLSREELQREVWGTDTFVDFDRSLNVCVAQIRATLGDDAEASRYIQTVPKRGYRFIAPVERVPAESSASQGASAPNSPAPFPRRRIWMLLAAGSLAGILIAAAGYFGWRRATSPDRILIAALPFENVGGAGSQDIFADGLTEELISQLGSLAPGRLGVIGRSSVMRYRSSPPNLDQIRRDLHVDYVIEGTIRWSAGRVRISSRLIQAVDQSQVWTETSERDETEMFQMQEEAAARISAAVTGKILSGARATPGPKHQPGDEAFAAYQNGRYLQHRGNRADLERSTEYFERAAKLDPRFDDAEAALAESCVSLARSGGPAGEFFAKARVHAEKALAIRESNAEAQNALGNVLFWQDWNWRSAEQHFRRAIEINPSMPLVHHDYAFLLIATGRPEQGVSSLRRAIAIDPLSPRVNIDAGWLLLQAHHYDEAIRQARRALELEPGMAEANACILRAYFHQRKYAEIVKLLPSAPSGANPEDVVRQAYRERADRSEPFTAATYYSFLGDKDKALNSLQQAFERHSMSMPLMKSEPGLSALHSEGRFQEIAQKVGLP